MCTCHNRHHRTKVWSHNLYPYDAYDIFCFFWFNCIMLFYLHENACHFPINSF
jgi:hypothetical protein